MKNVLAYALVAVVMFVAGYVVAIQRSTMQHKQLTKYDKMACDAGAIDASCN